MLYLVSNLAQEAILETALSAAFSLKHAAKTRETFASKQEAQERASQFFPKGASQKNASEVHPVVGSLSVAMER